MNHPTVLYMLAAQKIAEDHRQAEQARLARQIGDGHLSGTIDSVPFRARLTRLFGGWAPRPGNEGAAASRL